MTSGRALRLALNARLRRAAGELARRSVECQRLGQTRGASLPARRALGRGRTPAQWCLCGRLSLSGAAMSRLATSTRSLRARRAHTTRAKSILWYVHLREGALSRAHAPATGVRAPTVGLLSLFLELGLRSTAGEFSSHPNASRASLLTLHPPGRRGYSKPLGGHCRRRGLRRRRGHSASPAEGARPPSRDDSRIPHAILSRHSRSRSDGGFECPGECRWRDVRRRPTVFRPFFCPSKEIRRSPCGSKLTSSSALHASRSSIGTETEPS